MKVETLTPVVAAAPGSRAHWRLRVENDSSGPLGYRLDIVGFDPAYVLQPPPTPPLPPGTSTEVDLELLIPEAFAAGQHSIAVEVVPDRAGVAPVIAAVTVTVGKISDIALAVVPSTIRAHRRASFKVDIDNRSNRSVDLELDAEGPELQIRMRPDRVVMRPGERVRTSGRIKGPRHVFGEPVQRGLTVAARSRSAPAYAPATFQQRPMFPRGIRSLLAVLLIVGIWGGALGAGYLWWQSRNENTAEPAGAELVDTDGDGVPDTPGDVLVDTNGDGQPDTLASVVAENVAVNGPAKGPPQTGTSAQKTRAVLGGTVQAGDTGDPSGIDVTLTPIALGGAPPEGATPVGLAKAEGLTGGKVWPARFGIYDPVIRSGVRRTQSVASATTTDERGAWLFSSVPVGQSYEVSFARAGFDTQSFVVTPTGDGKPIELPVTLKPAQGAVSGTVTGPSGPLGNVQMVLTDGTLTFNSATTSGSGAGRFSFTGVSTPGTYSLTATLDGFGTEVAQISLEAGEQKDGVAIRMRAGVGSISGHITEDGQPLGGVSLSASNGDTSVDTTSLTQGDRGSYTFPQLDIPGRYTITASREGYVTQTRVVNLTGNARGVDFDFRKQTGAITGVVNSSNGGPLPGANVRVRRDKLSFDIQTAASGDPGSFNIRNLPPGTYLVEFSRFDHAPESQTVTVAPGQVVDLGQITLVFRPRPAITQNGSLEVRVVDSAGNPLNGTNVRLVRVSDETVVATQADTAGNQSSFTFQPLPIGTYRIEVNKDVTYRQSIRRVSIGLGNSLEVIPLYRLGQVSGRVIDSFTKEQRVDYDVQINRVNPDGSTTFVQNIPVPANAEPKPGSTEIRWESAQASLTSGTYQVVVINPPPGYTARTDQVLVPGLPPMRFVISPTDDTPINVGDLLVDRLPEIDGVVQVPNLVRATPTVPETITFVPVDDQSLAATVTCPNQPIGLPKPSITDTVGGSGLDTYFFDPVELDRTGSVGPCQLSVSAAGYVTKTMNIDIVAVRGEHSRIDRNVALFKPTVVGGQAYWVDPGKSAGNNHVPAGGVTVRPQGQPTTGFNPGNVPFTIPGSGPTPAHAVVNSVVTDAGGNWVFPGAAAAPPGPGPTTTGPKQVFGTTTYFFEKPTPVPVQFQRSGMALSISESGRSATGSPAPDVPLFVSPDGSEIQLDANGGVLTENVLIRTIKASPDLSGFTATLRGANIADCKLSDPISPLTCHVARTSAAFTTLDPGTHQLGLTLSPTATSDGTTAGRPLFDPATPADGTATEVLQGPGESPPAITKTWVERGSVNLHLVEKPPRAGAIGGAVVDLVSGPTSIPVTIAGPILGGNQDPDNIVTGLPVSLAPANPITTYTATVRQGPDGEFNFANSTYQVVNENGTISNGNLTEVRDPRDQTIIGGSLSFNVPQGGRPRVQITLSRFGTITGTVVGDNGDGNRVPLHVGDPPPTLVVTAERKADANCVPITTPTPEDTRPVRRVGDAYQFSGPAGYYLLTATHPNYEVNPTLGDPVQVVGDMCAGTGRIFHLVDDVARVLPGDWVLPIKRSSLTVAAVRNDSLTAGPNGVGDPVVGATISVKRNGVEIVSGQTDSNGQAVLAALIPGAYTIDVTKTQYFPVGFSLSIPVGGQAVSLQVPLPRVGGAITGLIVGVNQDGEPVTLGALPTVSDAYDAPDPTAGGATVGPAANPTTPQQAVVTADVDPTFPAGTSATYTLDALASGRHTLTYGSLGAAFATPAAQAVDVIGITPQTAARVNYVAANRTLVVTVTASPGDATGTTVTLNAPGAPAGSGVVQTVACAGTPLVCTATFPGVVPKIAAYSVVVAKDLFATQTVPVSIGPGNPATPITATVALTGSTARVSGTAKGRNTPVVIGQPSPDTNLTTGTVDLLTQGQPNPVGTVNLTNGTFTFDITAAGGYSLRVRAPGFAERTLPLTIANGDLGRTITGQDVIVPKLGTYTFTVSGGAPTAGITVTPTASGTRSVEPVVAGLSVTVDPGGGVPAPGAAPTYSFTLTSADGYLPATVAASTINIGETRTVPVTMNPRSISGTVTGLPAGSGPASVHALSGSTEVASPLTGGDFTFPGPFKTGSYLLVAELLGVGRGTATATVANDASPSLTGQNIALVARTVNVSFSSAPPGATIVVTKKSGTTVSGTAGTPIPVPENEFPISYVASLAGHDDVSSQTPVGLAVNESNTWTQTTLTQTVDQITLTPTTTTTIAPTTTTTAAPGP